MKEELVNDLIKGTIEKLNKIAPKAFILRELSKMLLSKSE
jgi:hypothetical protein